MLEPPAVIVVRSQRYLSYREWHDLELEFLLPCHTRVIAYLRIIPSEQPNTLYSGAVAHAWSSSGQRITPAPPYGAAVLWDSKRHVITIDGVAHAWRHETKFERVAALFVDTMQAVTK